ncbi:hypothetical protein GW17_00039721 [Ensete ventricosum]|nr:hypothetical protein GW17_00039721 [Ensete ventricosum]
MGEAATRRGQGDWRGGSDEAKEAVGKGEEVEVVCGWQRLVELAIVAEGKKGRQRWQRQQAVGRRREMARVAAKKAAAWGVAAIDARATTKKAALIPVGRTLGFYHRERGWKIGDNLSLREDWAS